MATRRVSNKTRTARKPRQTEKHLLYYAKPLTNRRTTKLTKHDSLTELKVQIADYKEIAKRYKHLWVRYDNPYYLEEYRKAQMNVDRLTDKLKYRLKSPTIKNLERKRAYEIRAFNTDFRITKAHNKKSCRR